MNRALLLAFFALGCSGSGFEAAEGSLDGGDADPAFSAAGSRALGSGGGDAAHPSRDGMAPGSGGSSGSGGTHGAGGGADGGVDGEPEPGGPDATGPIEPIEPACPMPTIGPEQMPERAVWQEFFYQRGDECFQCSNSPCGSCPIAWFPVEQTGDRVSATLNYTDCAETFSTFQIDFGPCGSESEGCAWWRLGGYAGVIVEFQLVPDATGWKAVGVTVSAPPDRVASAYPLTSPSCGNTVVDHQAIERSVSADFIEQMQALRWDCP